MAANPEKPGPHLTPADLAERYSVSLATIYCWNHEGTGPPYLKVGRHVRYRRSDVEAWEAKRVVRHAA